MAMVKSRNEVAAMEPEVMMGDESIKSRIFTIRGVQVMLVTPARLAAANMASDSSML